MHKWNLTEAMQKDVLQTAMYYLHQYASVYPLLDATEPVTHLASSPAAATHREACAPKSSPESVAFEQAILCLALLSLAMKTVFQNHFLEFLKIRQLLI